MIAGMRRLAKLRAMTLPELSSRAAYRIRLAQERRQHARRALQHPDRLRLAIDPALADRADWLAALRHEGRGRFFAWSDRPDELRRLFGRRYAPEKRKADAMAAEIMSGEITFFGRRVPLGDGLDWHADPVTGAAWPKVYHADVPVHGGDVGFGDVKYVWELNRHQFFVDLAKIAFLDRSPAHADRLHQLVRGWMREVPYATGAAWACALEPAFRAWSWIWAFHLLEAGELLTDDDRAAWMTGLFDHGRFLFRHLEHYSSPYNHLVGEAAALFTLGLLFPCFREAHAWEARGRDVLEATLDSQFHPDGGSVEQSAFYHHATLGFYLLAAILARRNGADVSPAVWSAIERGIGFSTALTQPDGRTPRIGGADDGKPIRLEHLPFWDFRPYQAIGAVLCERADFAFVAGRFWEDALWLLGPEGADAFDRLAQRPPATSVSLESSGYYVMRSGWSADADYVCFDCGPQAAGLRRDDVPSAAHGHADCLSVIAMLGGREVLVDPGFFCYNGDPRWEVHFRRTAAHNTITVNGQDQARHVSKMAWARTYAAVPEGWSSDSVAWARGSHDGYRRLPGGVTHRRTTWLRPDGYVVIFDELASGDSHGAEAVFQFAPGEAELNASQVRFEDRFDLAWLSSTPVSAQVTHGGVTPDSGWIAPSLGVRRPAPRLALSFPLHRRVGLLTILADSQRCRVQPCSESRVSGTRAPLRASVVGEGFADEILAASDGTASTADVDTDAPLVIVRHSSSGAVEARHVGGAYARWIRTDRTATAGSMERAAG